MGRLRTPTRSDACCSEAGRAPRALLADCARRRIPVVQSYGLTETASLVVALSAEDALRKPGSSGTTLDALQRFASSEMANPVPPAKSAKSSWAGPTVATGYVNSPGEFAHARSGNWFRTGVIWDTSTMRVICMLLIGAATWIITGGENVYPAEVEEGPTRTSRDCGCWRSG